MPGLNLFCCNKKKKSVAELESLVILVGKSIMCIWNKFKIAKVVSCWAELKTMEKIYIEVTTNNKF